MKVLAVCMFFASLVWQVVPATAQVIIPLQTVCDVSESRLAEIYGDRFELIPLAEANEGGFEPFLVTTVRGNAIVIKVPNGKFCVMWDHMEVAS